ncbi:2-amino-4-hydroxy-6-hydroxymethyldihydropteridine pyrophosphokinase [Mesobacillus campisalis]|uniref:2-amino-4-hydroxy-6-hydroxymethyldihydropteridine diphosphokinase n=1 Tax=Mesobacillus campisalis TaxID=1408103 RepID=A0A0M2SQ12_9BACI|nr:2-amino-4-hydroxy-6-hydroxymethyldihydropteridine diphosphokinase [Mesobacillus campisalis]KKK36639.1 2-amino-4-hydroxy-6-hydroxymethyldihydropteridine pyrophosphokinase [Mesobacillus campisalis]
MENTAYLALGSNIGDRLGYLGRAVELLHRHEKIEVVNTSSIYETDPVGYTDQDAFLNMVVKVQTCLGPLDLLEAVNKIEAKLGRKRGIRWGPRTLDLDILLYNQENINSEKLTVPHPRMQERAFVMIPLLEIDSVSLPGSDSITDIEGVRIWKRKNGEDVFALFVN